MRQKAYEKMTVYEKRVAVLKDVLLRLKVGSYVATTGGIMEFARVEDEEFLADTTNGEKPAQPFIKSVKFCEVCAKGAMVMSAVRIFNSMSCEELYQCSRPIAVSENPSMAKLFGRQLLDEMEVLFELRGIGADAFNSEETNTLERFIADAECAYVENPHHRLETICKLLIKNKGRKLVLKPWTKQRAAAMA